MSERLRKVWEGNGGRVVVEWGAGGICDREEMGTLWAKVESEGRS